MTLIQKIKDDQLTARKAREAVKAALLTTLLGDALNVGKNDGNRETTDQEVIAVVRKFLKGVDENFKHASDFNDSVKMQFAQAEKAILESYLPKQMTAEEIAYALAFEEKNKGKLMKYLKDNFAGQYDGKLAAQVVDHLLKG